MEKCKWCGKSFEKSDLNKFLGGATIGIAGSEKFCSKACKVAFEESQNKSNKSTKDSGSSRPVVIKQGPSAEEIAARAENERQERNENALYPWRFDDNFYNASSISAIVYPDSPEDIEKTILRIIKTAQDKVKAVIEMSFSEVQQMEMDDQKSIWKPFSKEINLADSCIEKASEGIKKLKRFEGNNVNNMLSDCLDSLEEFQSKWYPKLIAKKEKKKKQNKIMMTVVVILVVAMMIGLAAAA